MSKIVHVVGTSGAGKTTAVRRFVENLTLEPVMQEGRKLPIGYLVRELSVPLFLVGAYHEAGTAGCDTIKDVQVVYDLIREHWGAGRNVLFEGLFTMNHTRGVQLQNDTKAVTVLQLTTTLDQCKQSVLERRERVGNTKALTWVNTETNWVRAKNYTSKMWWAGAARIKVSREEAPDKLRELLS